jgi:hypothetical protein
VSGKPFVMIMHFARRVPSSEIKVRVSVNGVTFPNEIVATANSGRGDVLGISYMASSSGTYRFDFTDGAGNVLASGTIPIR